MNCSSLKSVQFYSTASVLKEGKAKTYTQSSQLFSVKKLTTLGGIRFHDTLCSGQVLY